jgi:hypothetical protein
LFANAKFRIKNGSNPSTEAQKTAEATEESLPVDRIE